MQKYLYLAAAAAAIALPARAEIISHIPMQASADGSLTETVGKSSLTLYGRFAPENVDGADGKALRLDGYSSYAAGEIAAPAAPAAEMTFSIWVAPEVYPIVKHDTPTDEKIRIAGTLDDEARSGWQFGLDKTGKYGFECYSGGWKVTVEASDLLPRYEWSHLVCVFDGKARTATLYRNGNPVGTARTMDTVDASARNLYIGKNAENRYLDAFLINTFCGLIDDIRIYDTALSAEEVAAFRPENEADLSIPASRFDGQLLRPRFHGMPAAGWTNESHGMTYSDGRYHVFFQKNANGPFMSRLHWGHISSDNLFDWREEKIAISPDMSYDTKGCWSGCVFSDDEITDGRPGIIYTAVDYAKATMAMALPADDALVKWEKSPSNPIISGRPSGLSDDFRDPYFFRNGDDAYIIVGTSKGNVGATTLHKYNPATQRWSNDGQTFFAGTSAAQHGRFWEMPNVTRMSDDKWLFTTTPLDMTGGVRTIYWTGSIAADGTFTPDSGSASPRQVELISRDGYGLLSPTIFQKDGKTIALGIVPDKISGSDNANLGWAHLYSLPREWSLDSRGNLIQRPYEGLRAMRSSTRHSESNITLSGERELDVKGRQAEVLATFTVGSAPFGFNFFKGASGEGSLTYNPGSGELRVDFSRLSRLNNDGGSFNGVYTCTLPEKPAAGDDMTINLFIDGSILDIFIDNRWATSIRVFPTADDADGIEVFSNGAPTSVRSLDAWVLKSEGGSGSIEGIGSDSADDSLVDVMTTDGMLLKSRVDAREAHLGLPKGIYIIGSRKVVVP